MEFHPKIDCASGVVKRLFQFRKQSEEKKNYLYGIVVKILTVIEIDKLIFN